MEELPADLDAKIRSLRVAGRTHRQICEALGVSKGRVARVLGSGSVTVEAEPDEPLASGSWVSLAEYDPPGGMAPPSRIRFPGDEEVEIRGWNGALISAAEWLVATGRLTAANIPVPSSNHGYIVNDRPVHPTGNAFVRHKTLGNGLVVFTPGYSASNARRLVCKLLEHCGVRADAVWLQVGSSSGG